MVLMKFGLGDVLLRKIFSYFQNCHSELLVCCLVNHEFFSSASKVLYANVVVSPPTQVILNLRERIRPRDQALLIAASSSKYASLVRNLEVGGCVSSRDPPLNPLPLLLVSVITACQNLRSIKLHLPKFHDELRPIWDALESRFCLKELHLNSECANAEQATSVVRIGGLSVLSLVSPCRAMLQLLPEWLDRLSDTLKEFHLLENCGSVTPGVLRSFVPHLSRVQSLSLGLSYSLTNADVFEFLGNLPKLRSLRFRYYLQLHTPTSCPPLSNLTRLTVRYPLLEHADHVEYLSRWVKRIASESQIEVLQLLGGDDDVEFDEDLSFDALISDFWGKHGSYLRVLDIVNAFVGAEALKILAQRATNLELLRVSTSRQLLVDLLDFLEKLKSIRVLELRVEVYDELEHFLDMAAIRNFFDVSRTLIQIKINETTWEGSWIIEDGSGKIVHQTTKKITKKI